MNNTLSFPRLLRLMRKHWIENFQFYGMATLALLGLLAIVFTIWALNSGQRFSEDGLYIIYLVGLFMTGCIFASISFSMLGDKAKGVFWLSLPASHLEKLITVVFFSTILFFVVYSLCFFTLKSIVELYIKQLITKQPFRIYEQVNWKGNGGEYDGFGFVFRIFLYGFVAVQALYLMGSAFFSKHAFIKTTIITAFVFFMLVQYVYHFGKWMTLGLNTGPNLLNLSQETIDILVWIVKLIWAPVFWTIAYFRLKETAL